MCNVPSIPGAWEEDARTNKHIMYYKTIFPYLNGEPCEVILGRDGDLSRVFSILSQVLFVAFFSQLKQTGEGTRQAKGTLNEAQFW